MTTIDIRPRFRQTFEAPPEQVMQQFQTLLDQAEAPVVGRVSKVIKQIILKVPQEERHYWSPQLALNLDEFGSGSEIRGLFGPRSSVWLMFIFFYAVLGIISLFIGITGGAQAALGQEAPVLWIIPICAVIALVLFFVAKAGERLGREQMYILYDAYQAALRIPIQEAPAAVEEDQS